MTTTSMTKMMKENALMDNHSRKDLG